jgi:hypothetical protein
MQPFGRRGELAFLGNGKERLDLPQGDVGGC